MNHILVTQYSRNLDTCLHDILDILFRYTAYNENSDYPTSSSVFTRSDTTEKASESDQVVVVISDDTIRSLDDITSGKNNGKKEDIKVEE